MPGFVIVVDTQRDFMAADGALSVPGAEALVGPMQDWLRSLKSADVAGVLFTFDTHVPEIYAVSDEAKEFPVHCVRGSAGWANMLDTAVVHSAIPVHRLEKGVFDMWAEPDLAIEDARDDSAPPVRRDAFFEGLRVRGVREVIVIGVAADYCVRWAIDGLVERGFAVTVSPSLTRGIHRSIEQVVEEDFAGAEVRLG